jgi:hypothetical protein
MGCAREDLYCMAERSTSMSTIDALQIAMDKFLIEHGELPSAIYLSCNNYKKYVEELDAKMTMLAEGQKIFNGIPILSELSDDLIFLQKGEIRSNELL